jgi:hypothetical protein
MAAFGASHDSVETHQIVAPIMVAAAAAHMPVTML